MCMIKESECLDFVCLNRQPGRGQKLRLLHELEEISEFPELPIWVPDFSIEVAPVSPRRLPFKYGQMSEFDKSGGRES